VSATDFYEDIDGVVGCDLYNSFEIQPLNASGCTSLVIVEGVGVFSEALVVYLDGGQYVTQFNLHLTAGQLALIGAETGSPLGGTAAVSASSENVVFSLAQTIGIGSALTFAAQPGCYYFLSAAVATSQRATLSTPYTGTPNGATVAGVVLPVGGSTPLAFAPSPSSGETVPSSTSAVGLIEPGDTVLFSTQPTQPYQVAQVTTGAVVLTTPYTGSIGSAYAIDVDSSPMQAGTYPYRRQLTWPGSPPIVLPYGHGVLHLAPTT
jgi:hypothetical protein